MTTRMYKQLPSRWSARRLLAPVAVATVMFGTTAASVAWAGEIKFGESTLEVDDKGNLTSAGRKAVVDVLDEVPGEDRWETNLWAKLDNPAEGPLYFQFYQDLNGTLAEVWRYDEDNFGGGKHFSADIVLEGGRGFNKDRTYEVKAIQVSTKGKDLVLATGKIKLIKSGKKPVTKDDDDEDKVPVDQDAIDSLVGGEEPEGDEPPKEAPPPVEPKAKKGCAVDPSGSAWNGALLLLVLGAGLVARRRS